LFVVFEGIDGSGTSTQAKLLAKNLQERQIETFSTAQPSGFPTGKLVREILQGKTGVPPAALQLLFCADRAGQLESEIQPALRDGKVVVCERYFFSTLAFGALACDPDWLESVCRIFPQPDLTFFLQIDPAVAVQRIAGRGESRELFERQETLQGVAQNFQNIFANRENVVIFNAHESAEKIAHGVLTAFLQQFEKRKNS